MNGLRALVTLLPLLAVVPTSFAGELDGYRVAAIIHASENSKALIEDASGEQSWFAVGDRVDTAEVVVIDKDRVTLRSSEREFTMSLRADGRAVEKVAEEALEPAAEQSRSYQYVNLISEIESTEPRDGESQSAADTRAMNRALGLGRTARITAINKVDVKNAAEARAELQQRLMSNETIRITVAGDETEVLYVVPDY